MRYGSQDNHNIINYAGDFRIKVVNILSYSPACVAPFNAIIDSKTSKIKPPPIVS